MLRGQRRAGAQTNTWKAAVCRVWAAKGRKYVPQEEEEEHLSRVAGDSGRMTVAFGLIPSLLQQ